MFLSEITFLKTLGFVAYLAALAFLIIALIAFINSGKGPRPRQ